MGTQETYYSLCVTVRYKTGYTELLRLADIITNNKDSGKTGGILFPFNCESELPDVKTISMDKYEANSNELHIWRWELQPNKTNRQYSYRTDWTFYELIFLNNLNLNSGLTVNSLSIWDLFDTLLDGFIVPTGFTNSLQPPKPFLLVVNQTDAEYICLEIPESSYTCDGNRIRIHENTPLNERKILQSDVIDTNEYTRNLNTFNQSPDPALQRRIIYKRRDLWRAPVATLPLKRFNAHLTEYLGQAIDRLSGQVGDKEVIEALVNNITKNAKSDSNLMTFLRGYYSQPNGDSLALTLENYHPLESVFTSYLEQISMDEKLLEFIVDNLPSLREKYLQVLTEGYLEKEKQKLLHQLAPLRTQIEELDGEFGSKLIQKEELKAEIMSLLNSREELLAQIRESKQRRQEFDELLNGKRAGLLQELNTLKKLLQWGESASEASKQNTNSPVLTLRPGKHLEYEDEESIEEIAQLFDMCSLLLENLPEQGADTPSVLELSKFISASYLCHFPLLCVGTSADDMARIISISFNNQLPDTVCIPSGYNNYSSLVNTIRSLKSDIVVLENVVGFCDEYCYTHLAEDVPEKYIIFLTEYEETLKILPKGIYAHMGLILCDKFFTTQLKSNDRPCPGKITGSISSSPDNDTRSEILDRLLKLTRGAARPTGYVNSRVKVLQAITQDDNIDEIIKVIYTELISIIEIYGISEDYNDKIRASTDPVVRDFRERLGVEKE